MEKLIVGPSSKGAIDLKAPVRDNLKAIAKRLDRDVETLVIIVLDRPRHARLIQEIREAGARIRLIGDGDLSAGISVALRGTGVHAVMGIGGAPEGVITAAACVVSMAIQLASSSKTKTRKNACVAWESQT